MSKTKREVIEVGFLQMVPFAGRDGGRAQQCRPAETPSLKRKAGGGWTWHSKAGLWMSVPNVNIAYVLERDVEDPDA